MASRTRYYEDWVLRTMKTGREYHAGEIYLALEANVHAPKDISSREVRGALTRLEAEALVNSRLGKPTPARGGRAKRFYRITPRGKAALN
jgi:DNA-binding PadR family transcriptional regulator